MTKINKISFSGESSTNLLSQIKTGQQTTLESPKPQEPVHSSANIIAPPVLKEATNSNKEALYLTSAVALASLGVTTVLALKNGKLNQKLAQLHYGIKEKDEAIKVMTKKIEELGNKIKEDVNVLAQKIESKTKQTEEHISRTENSLDKQIKDLGKWEDGQIDGARRDLSAKIDSRSIAPVRVGSTEEILTDSVNINGRDLRLATVEFGYGKHQHTIENLLRTEATKRIFNLIDRSKIQPKEDIVVRVLASDFTNFLAIELFIVLLIPPMLSIKYRFLSTAFLNSLLG